MKNIVPGLILTLLSLPIPVHAVLLDCEIDRYRIYTCTEAGGPATATRTQDGTETSGDEYRQYIDQAKQQCVYNEPRQRVAGKNSGGALKMELLKSAREEYEQCIRDTARELRRSNNPPGASDQKQ